MKRWYILILAVLLGLSATGVYAYNTAKNISKNVIRLHIVGNSNNVFDQKIKYQIRDKVIKKYNFEAEDIEKQKLYISDNLDNIKADVDKWLIEAGVDYGCRVVFDEEVFPTREYQNLKLPYGKYTALKIILGNGDGRNWWCVMFPPLCFTDGTTGMIDSKSDRYLKENLSSEDYELITSDDIEIRFKLVEVVGKIFN